MNCSSIEARFAKGRLHGLVVNTRHLYSNDGVADAFGFARRSDLMSHRLQHAGMMFNSRGLMSTRPK